MGVVRAKLSNPFECLKRRACLSHTNGCRLKFCTAAMAITNGAENTVKTKNTIDVTSQKQVEDEAEKTASLFQTAYILAKNNRPYTDYQDLVVLQQENCLNMGTTLHSRYSAKGIIDHTAKKVRQKILNHMLTKDQRFSVLGLSC